MKSRIKPFAIILLFGWVDQCTAGGCRPRCGQRVGYLRCRSLVRRGIGSRASAHFLRLRCSGGGTKSEGPRCEGGYGRKSRYQHSRIFLSVASRIELGFVLMQGDKGRSPVLVIAAGRAPSPRRGEGWGEGVRPPTPSAAAEPPPPYPSPPGRGAGAIE